MNIVKILLAITAISTVCMAQNTSSGRLANSNNGAIVQTSIFNTTSQPYIVANGAGFSGSPVCTAAPVGSAAAIYADNGFWFSDGATSVFETNLRDWAFPDSVSITRLTFQLCYYLYGAADTTLVVVPVLYDTVSGTLTEGPTLLTVTGNANPLRYYLPPGPTTTGTKTVSVGWNLGANAINSSNAKNIHIGIRIRNTLVPVNYSYYQYLNVIKLTGVSVIAGWNRTAQPITVSAATISYVSAGYNQGTLTVSQPPTTQSAAVPSIIYEVKCPNGIWYQFGSFNPGGFGTRPMINTFAMSSINALCPLGQQFHTGSTLQIRTKPTAGTPTLSNTLTL